MSDGELDRAGDFGIEVHFDHPNGAVDPQRFGSEDRGAAMHRRFSRRRVAVLQIGMISGRDDFGCACDVQMVMADAFRMGRNCSQKKHRKQRDSVQDGAEQFQA